MSKIFKLVILMLLFIIPIVNIIVCFKILFRNDDTLLRWTSHKDLLWNTNIENVEIKICNGNGYDILYKGKFGLLDSCTDNKNKDLLFLTTIPIKYINIIDDKTLGVQLWNQKKKLQDKLDDIAKKYMLGMMRGEENE